MNCSMTGQEKCDLLIQVTAYRGDLMGRFDCIYIIMLFIIDYAKIMGRMEDIVHDPLSQTGGALCLSTWPLKLKTN